MKERQTSKSTGETRSFQGCNKPCTTASVPKETLLISVIVKAGYVYLYSFWKVFGVCFACGFWVWFVLGFFFVLVFCGFFCQRMLLFQSTFCGNVQLCAGSQQAIRHHHYQLLIPYAVEWKTKKDGMNGKNHGSR